MTRLARLQALLDAEGLDALLLTSPEGRRYATDFASSDGVVLVTPKTAWLYVDFRYLEAARTAAAGCTVTRVTRGNLMPTVHETLKAHDVKRLGFEDGSMTVAQWKRWSEALDAALLPIGPALSRLRMVKDAEEIVRLEEAQRMAERAFVNLLPGIRPGESERAVAARLVHLLLSEGAERLSFDPIVVSGPNSALPHGVPTDRLLARGDALILDFGLVHKGYCSDTTRTLFLGQATDEMIAVYDLVLRAQSAGIEKAAAGVSGRDIDAAARDIITEAGFGPCFGHSFGHGMGLEIHEPGGASPTDLDPLPAGAVLTAEPGVYLPGRFGVRIEDVLVLHADGARNLTRLPKSLTVLDFR